MLTILNVKLQSLAVDLELTTGLQKFMDEIPDIVWLLNNEWDFKEQNYI